MTELGGQIARLRATTAPALVVVEAEGRLGLARQLSSCLPEHDDAKPTKAWVKRAMVDFGQTKLVGILGILGAHQPDGSYCGIHQALVYAGLATNPAQFAQKQMPARILQKPLAAHCLARDPGQGIATARLAKRNLSPCSTQMPQPSGQQTHG